MKKLLCVLALMALVGCQSKLAMNSHPLTDRDYVASAMSAIQSRFYDVDSYRGKRCKILLHQAGQNLPDSVTADGGDPELCEAAVNATKQAIDMDIYPRKPMSSNIPDTIPLEFAPQ